MTHLISGIGGMFDVSRELRPMRELALDGQLI